MAAAGVTASAGSTATEYATLATERGQALPGSGLAAWAASTLWFPAFLCTLAALPLLFPDGRLPSPRWRVPAWCALVAGMLATAGVWTTQAILDDGGYPEVHNALDLPLDDDTQLVVVLVCFVVVAVVGAAAALGDRLADARRRRRPTPAERLVRRRVLLGGFGSLLPAPDLVQFALTSASVACLAIGIVRHGLFAIEVALSRAVVYALLTAAALGRPTSPQPRCWARARTPGCCPPCRSGGGTAAREWSPTAAGVGRPGDVRRAARPGRRVDRARRTAEPPVDDDEVLPSHRRRRTRNACTCPTPRCGSLVSRAPASWSGEMPERAAQFDLVHAGEHVGVLVVGLRRGETQLSVRRTSGCWRPSRSRSESRHTPYAPPASCGGRASASCCRARRNAGGSGASSTTGWAPRSRAFRSGLEQAAEGRAPRDPAADPRAARRAAGGHDRLRGRGTTHRDRPASAGARPERARRSPATARRSADLPLQRRLSS